MVKSQIRSLILLSGARRSFLLSVGVLFLPTFTGELTSGRKIRGMKDSGCQVNFFFQKGWPKTKISRSLGKTIRSLFTALIHQKGVPPR